MRILLSPDPAAGGGLTDQTPNPSATPPAGLEPVKSAGVVKKTAIKTPREIELEKAVARLEDKVDGLSAWQKEVTDFMASQWIKPAPRPAAAATAPAGATKTASTKPADPVLGPTTTAAAAAVKGVLDDVGRELGI